MAMEYTVFGIPIEIHLACQNDADIRSNVGIKHFKAGIRRFDALKLFGADPICAHVS